MQITHRSSVHSSVGGLLAGIYHSFATPGWTSDNAQTIVEPMPDHDHVHDYGVTSDPEHQPHQLLWASTWPLHALSVGPSCVARVAVPDAVRLHLESWPGGVHEPGRVVSCELEPGHDDDHAALGQEAGLTSWSTGPLSGLWLSWSLVGTTAEGASVRMEETVPCAHQLAERWMACRLPTGHAGRHSGAFDVEGLDRSPADRDCVCEMMWW